MADTRERLRALEKCWYREMEAAATYRALAEREKNPRRRDILQKLTTAELGHAAKWEARIRELGGTPPDPSAVKPGLGLALQMASPEVIFRKLDANEARDLAADEPCHAPAFPLKPKIRLLHETVSAVKPY